MTVNSITAAASSAVSGDTIAIWGMEHPVSGKPIAYSETDHFSTGGGEIFPISFADGVRVVGHPSSPRVVIGSEAPIAPNLLHLGNASSLATTVFENLSLAGGAIALNIEATASGVIRNVEVKDLVFESNSLGIQVRASDQGQIRISINDCKLLDLTTPSFLGNSPPIVYQSQSTGIRFHIGGSGDSCLITAGINNLTNFGDFDSMSPAVTQSFFSRRPYLEVNTSTQASTKMIEVLAQPGAAEHGGSGMPKAIISLNGCLLNGKAASDGKGWDWGLYCFAEGDPGISYDYSTMFDVTAAGTNFDGFRLGGVMAFTNLNCRGLVKLIGNTVITDSGKHVSSGLRPYLHSGVSLESYESYLGLVGSNFTSTRNQGHGVFLYSEGAVAAERIYDSGLYLGLEDSEVSSNSRNGITMRASSKFPGDSFAGNVQQSAIVGGTWHRNSLNLGFSLIEEGDEPMAGIIPIGQGYLNRCRIFENTERGIYTSSEGNGDKTVISNRLVNSFVWNNPLGGVVADMDPNPEYGYMPDHFFPIVHSDLIHNGNSAGSSDFSFEVDNQNSIAPATGLFEWGEPSTTGGGDPSGNLYLRTRLLSSIFDRDGTGTNDFGPIVNPQLVADLDYPTPPPNHQIGVGGIRAFQLGPSIAIRFSVSTVTVPPFIGGSSEPSKWQLDSSHTDFAGFDHTLSFVSVEVPEATSDYALTPRPGIAQANQRDKGAYHQVP